jgi:hypothetical protein
VQVTPQLVFAAHETLPLSPTVTTQLELGWQVMLQDLPQVPVHVLCSEHSSEQLSEVPQGLAVKSQRVLLAQMQLDPEQLGGGVPPSPAPIVLLLLLPPHPTTHHARAHATRIDISPPFSTSLGLSVGTPRSAVTRRPKGGGTRRSMWGSFHRVLSL